MATYRLSLSVAKRSDGRNAVAMAAYRSGAELWSERTGETLDFTRRHGILSSDIVLPEGAPSWASEREALWNRSELAHRRQDAVVARELQLSLPHELTAGQRREVTLGFAQSIATRYGIAVDTSIHAPSRVGDERNHHAHLLLCTRPFDESSKTGFGNNLRAFDAVAHQRAGTENHVESLRQEWCDRLNDALKRAQVKSADGASVTLDHRSYDRQGVDKEPSVKLGPAASAMERRGVATERGDENRAAAARNQQREHVRGEIERLHRRRAHLMSGVALAAEGLAIPSTDPGDLEAAFKPDLTFSGGTTVDESQRRLYQEQAQREELDLVVKEHLQSLGTAPKLREMENRRIEFPFDPTGDPHEQFRMHQLHLNRLDDQDKVTLEHLRAHEVTELSRKLQEKHQELRHTDRITADRASKGVPDEIRRSISYRIGQSDWYEQVDRLRYEARGRLLEAFERDQAKIHQDRLDAQAARDTGYREQLQQAYAQMQPDRDTQGFAAQHRDVNEVHPEPVPRHTALSGIEELRRKIGLPEPDDDLQREKGQVKKLERKDDWDFSR